MDVTQPALTWVGWVKKLRRLASKFQLEFDLHQSQRNSSFKVNASARKAWPNGVASRPKFSTRVYLQVRLARVLCRVLIGVLLSSFSTKGASE